MVVGGQGRVERLGAGERGVEGVGQAFGPEEGVADALSGDGILRIARVADKRPPGTIRRVEVVGDGAAVEAVRTLRRVDTAAKSGARSNISR